MHIHMAIDVQIDTRACKQSCIMILPRVQHAKHKSRSKNFFMMVPGRY